MKKSAKILIVLSTVVLAACSSQVPYTLHEQNESYTEYLVSINEGKVAMPSIDSKAVEFGVQGNHPTVLGDNKVGEKAEFQLLNTEIIAGHGHVYTLDEEDMNMLRIMKDGEEIFSSSSFYGADTSIVSKSFVEDKLLVSFMKRVDEEGNAEIETFWEGGKLEVPNFVKNVRGVFEYEGKKGFLFDHNDDGKVYLMFDGQVVSPYYDSVSIRNCCADFSSVYNLYEDGTFRLHGKREGESYLLEVDLGGL